MSATITHVGTDGLVGGVASLASEHALFSSMLLAIDFTPPSLAAARWAVGNIAAGAEPILAHVIPFAGPGAGTPAAENMQAREAALAGSLRGFAATLRGGLSAARIVLHVGRASQGLSDAAVETGAPLIVLGRRGNANRRRVGEPNVTERVVRGTGASVLVVPEDVVEPPRHVIAAVDDGPFVAAVLGAASRVAALHGCQLTLVHVLSPVAGAYDRLIRAAQHLVARGRRHRRPTAPVTPGVLPKQSSPRLIAMARSAVANGGTLDVSVGDAAREIAAAAASRQSPLLVVGLRGADGAPVGSIGSVARELLARASVPVLAITGQARSCD